MPSNPTLLPHFGILKNKVPLNLRCKCFHFLLDAALKQISTTASTASAKEDPDLSTWKLNLNEFYLLRDDLVAILKVSRRANTDPKLNAEESTNSHSQSLIVDSFLKDNKDQLGQDLIRLIGLCLEVRKSDINASFQSKASSISSHKKRLDSFDWKVNFLLSSDKCVNVNETNAFLELRLEKGDDARPNGAGIGLRGTGWKRTHSTSRLVTLDLSLAEIRRLISLLTQASTALDQPVRNLNCP